MLHIFFINGSENLTQMVPDSLNEGMVYKQMVYWFVCRMAKDTCGSWEPINFFFIYFYQILLG